MYMLLTMISGAHSWISVDIIEAFGCLENLRAKKTDQQFLEGLVRFSFTCNPATSKI